MTWFSSAQDGRCCCTLPQRGKLKHPEQSQRQAVAEAARAWSPTHAKKGLGQQCKKLLRNKDAATIKDQHLKTRKVIVRDQQPAQRVQFFPGEGCSQECNERLVFTWCVVLCGKISSNGTISCRKELAKFWGNWDMTYVYLQVKIACSLLCKGSAERKSTLLRNVFEDMTGKELLVDRSAHPPLPPVCDETPRPRQMVVNICRRSGDPCHGLPDPPRPAHDLTMST